MPFSTTYGNNILNYVFGKVSTLTPPSRVYAALLSNDPEAEGGRCVELSGGNYARELISLKGEPYPDYINTSTVQKVANVKQIAFNKATEAWLTIKGFALYDAETNGSLIYYSKTKNEISISAGDVALFEPSTLSISLADTDVEV